MDEGFGRGEGEWGAETGDVLEMKEDGCGYVVDVVVKL